MPSNHVTTSPNEHSPPAGWSPHSPRPTFNEVLDVLMGVRRGIDAATKRVEIEPPKTFEEKVRDWRCSQDKASV